MENEGKRMMRACCICGVCEDEAELYAYNLTLLSKRGNNTWLFCNNCYTRIRRYLSLKTMERSLR